MLRRSPRAVLLWAAAVVVAIVTTASVGGTLASLHRQDSRYGKPRAVVVAAHDLALGTVVGRSDVREVKVREASEISLTLLFDPEHNLEERILNEQFVP